jgi:lipopolysaccharide biosynthesis glycosyltransferase
MIKEIPIFYACDDAFAKYTIVSLASMIKNASKEYTYKIYVLHTNISKEMIDDSLLLAQKAFQYVKKRHIIVKFYYIFDAK